MLYNIPNVDRSSKLPAEIDFLLILDWLPTIPIFPSLSHVTPNESEQKIFFCGQFRTSGDIQIGWYYFLILTPNLICTRMCTRMWMSIENLRLWNSPDYSVSHVIRFLPLLFLKASSQVCADPVRSKKSECKWAFHLERITGRVGAGIIWVVIPASGSPVQNILFWN